MVHNGTSKVLKTTKKFICKYCNYKCSDSSNFQKHINTKKHKTNEMVHNGTSKVLKSTEFKKWACECCS